MTRRRRNTELTWLTQLLHAERRAQKRPPATLRAGAPRERLAAQAPPRSGLRSRPA